MRAFTIGQLARKAKVNVETIRYYERRELIPDPPRRESGYRQYSQDAAARIAFIKRAQELGFSLKEVSELLSLRAGSEASCCDVRRRAEAKVANIKEKIGDLQRIGEALKELISACEERGPLSECPILDALSSNVTPSATG